MGRRAPASTRPEAQLPAAPAWHLDSVGVLETATPRKVAFYERLGFRVVLDADAPGGGPHVWFLRCDP